MVSVNIEDLVKMGFTYEDLYKKGILTVKEEATPAEDPAPAEDPTPEEDPVPAEDPAPEEKPQPDMESLIKAYVQAATQEIRKELQKINLKSAERTDDENKMTVDDAIIGLMKGM